VGLELHRRALAAVGLALPVVHLAELGRLRRHRRLERARVRLGELGRLRRHRRLELAPRRLRLREQRRRVLLPLARRRRARVGELGADGGDLLLGGAQRLGEPRLLAALQLALRLVRAVAQQRDGSLALLLGRRQRGGGRRSRQRPRLRRATRRRVGKAAAPEVIHAARRRDVEHICAEKFAATRRSAARPRSSTRGSPISMSAETLALAASPNAFQRRHVKRLARAVS